MSKATFNFENKNPIESQSLSSLIGLKRDKNETVDAHVARLNGIIQNTLPAKLTEINNAIASSKDGLVFLETDLLTYTAPTGSKYKKLTETLNVAKTAFVKALENAGFNFAGGQFQITTQNGPETKGTAVHVDQKKSELAPETLFVLYDKKRFEEISTAAALPTKREVTDEKSNTPIHYNQLTAIEVKLNDKKNSTSITVIVDNAQKEAKYAQEAPAINDYLKSKRPAIMAAFSDDNRERTFANFITGKNEKIRFSSIGAPTENAKIIIDNHEYTSIRGNMCNGESLKVDLAAQQVPAQQVPAEQAAAQQAAAQQAAAQQAAAQQAAAQQAAAQQAAAEQAAAQQAAAQQAAAQQAAAQQVAAQQAAAQQAAAQQAAAEQAAAQRAAAEQAAEIQNNYKKFICIPSELIKNRNDLKSLITNYENSIKQSKNDQLVSYAKLYDEALRINCVYRYAGEAEVSLPNNQKSNEKTYEECLSPASAIQTPESRLTNNKPNQNFYINYKDDLSINEVISGTECNFYMIVRPEGIKQGAIIQFESNKNPIITHGEKPFETRTEEIKSIFRPIAKEAILGLTPPAANANQQPSATVQPFRSPINISFPLAQEPKQQQTSAPAVGLTPPPPPVNPSFAAKLSNTLEAGLEGYRAKVATPNITSVNR